MRQAGWRYTADASGRKGKLEVVRLLISRGANVNAEDSEGCTPLKAAASQGHLDVVKFLLEKGADPNAIGYDQMTSLESAAEEGNEELVRVLLDGGADVDAGSPYGWTALMKAAKKGNLRIVKVLLDKGADVDIKDAYDGATALMTLPNAETWKWWSYCWKKGPTSMQRPEGVDRADMGCMERLIGCGEAS